MKNTLYNWLTLQVQRGDEVGDFAIYATNDKNYPKRAFRPDNIRRYIREMDGKTSKQLENFKKAFDEYNYNGYSDMCDVIAMKMINDAEERLRRKLLKRKP